MTRTVVVTGATRGIGREIALRFAGGGDTVAATGRDESELASLAAEIEALGATCITEVADLSRPEEIERMTGAFLRKLPTIDVLVNNAGTSSLASALETTVEDFDRMIHVNLRAPLLVAQQIARRMLAAGRGAIVNIGSLAGEVALVDHAAYCASKFGLHGLTKVMALEWAEGGVRVNAVAPTVVLTPMGERVWGDPAVGDPMKAKIPMKKFLVPADVADAVLFLASERARLITGEVLMIDGGYSIQ